MTLQSLLEQTDFKRILLRTVLLPIAVMALLAGILYWQINTLLNASQQVERTDTVLNLSSDLLTLLVDAETGQRGYLVGGDRKFLETYDRAMATLDPMLDKLLQLSRQNPAQIQRLDTIRASYREWAENAWQEMEVRRKGNDYQTEFNHAHGKAVMDRMRGEIADFEQEETTMRSRWVENVKRSTLLVKGIVLGLTIVLGVLLAISTRRQMRNLLHNYTRSLELIFTQADALRKSEESFATTLASIGDAVISTDTDGKVVFLNPVAEHLTGWTYANALGKDAKEIFHILNMKTREIVASPLEQVQREGTVVGLANHSILLSRDGHEIPIDDSAAPIHDREGNFAGIVLVFRDVSERYTAEKERQILEERFQTIFSQSVLPMAMETLDGRIMVANQACCEYYGYPLEELTQLNMTDLIYPDDLALAPDVLNKLASGEIKDYTVERRYLRKDKRIVWGRSRVSLARDEKGEPAYLVGLTEDTTAEHQTKAVMEQKEREIELLNERLKRAMQETHHRVRNNLQILAALIDMQVADDNGMLPIREFKRLGMHVNALAALHSFLTEAARNDADLSAISISEVMDRLLPTLSMLAGTRPFLPDFEDFSLPLRQGTSLAVIINELVNNAVQHGMGRIGVHLFHSNDTAVLVVTDEGAGFPLDFDPIKKANLGLTLVDNLARWDMGGTVSFGRRPEGGAEVRIIFPIKT